MTRLGALRRNRSGAAAVEFALVAPLFLSLVIGTVELSRWAWGAAATRDLAARAARCITVTPALCGSVAATDKAMAGAAPLISAATELRYEKAACGVRITADGGFPALITPGLGRVEGRACAG
jgi:Flp pilus assembly protein TadG